MGSWECYCALCSGPLTIYSVNLGQDSTDGPLKRRKLIKKRIRELERLKREEETGVYEHENDSNEVVGNGKEEKDGVSEPKTAREDIDMSDNDEINQDDRYSASFDSGSETSDLSISERWLSDTGGMYGYDEEDSYDPRSLSLKDLKWLDRCRTLGFNSQAPGITKAFISGRGRYTDLGSFEIGKDGKDPNDPGKDEHDCYTAGGGDVEDPTFPFHEACFRVLARHLGYTKPKAVDKDVLYSTMKQYSEEWAGNLDLDYGGVEAEQFWFCQPGDEYLVCSPDMDHKLLRTLPSLIPSSLFHVSAPPDLSCKVRNDPLRVLPFDMLYSIFEYLSIDDILSAMQASWHIFSLTRDRTFWRQMTRLHLAPWFWELADIAAHDQLHPEFDYKGMVLWLHEATKPRYGIEGPFMGIANRRRIWNVCKQLAPTYQLKKDPAIRKEPDDEEAKAVLNAAVSLHMPMTLYPQPNVVRTIHAQFIRSWSEITHQQSNLETYFNVAGALTGISVDFGNSHRLFGSDEGERGPTMHIREGDWIKEIVVHLGSVDMLGRDGDRSEVQVPQDMRPVRETFIQALEVGFMSGRRKYAKSLGRGFHTQRSYAVLPDMHLIGLTGQIAANGAISRLGLLQAFPPGKDQNELPTYTAAQQYLWHSDKSIVSQRGKIQEQGIWSHPNLIVHPLSLPDRRYDPLTIPIDMLPHQLLHWAKSPEELKDLTCINALEVPGGTDGSGKETYDLIAIQPEYSIETTTYLRSRHRLPFIGMPGPVPAQHGIKQWSTFSNPPTDLHEKFTEFDPRFIKTFEIDGAGGEIITTVSFSDDTRSIKLSTNWNRSEVFGFVRKKVEDYRWVSYTAGEGEMVVGLSICFGTLSGWIHGAKMWSHWTLREVGVLLQKVEGFERFEANEWL